MKFAFLISVSLLATFSSIAQSIKCYPTNWWTGMKNPSLQLMLHGKNIGSKKVLMSYPGVSLKKINKVENNNYLFVDILISSNTQPGTMQIKIGTETIPFQLKRKNTTDGRTRIQGVTSSDIIYFLMPDRFSNGDANNDSIAGLLEINTGIDKLPARHGGDFKGIENHLDYIHDLGANTIWMTPVIINDMKSYSYHGYSFTDHYTIEPRFGGDSMYHDLIERAHKKGMKIIQDAVYNHVGIEHITVRDMPMKDWLNQWPSYTNTSYKDQVLFDPYASDIDKRIMTDGWFTTQMPDLNQRNPYVGNYLIQHAIWTTENFGIDGWRIDTYAYCDRDFMNKCNKALLEEFPQLGIFAETWVHGTVNQAFFAANNFNIPFKSNLQGVTDFQIHFAIEEALTSTSQNAVDVLYTTLAKDFVYKDPNKNCVFLDNHDMDRFYSSINRDLNKFKMGLNWIMTLRGIPAVYYGTEILMDGTTHPTDALVRKDFPGGWPNDKINKFTSEGRTDSENIAYNFLKKLMTYRNNSTAIKTGHLMQYVPSNGVYVYFRFDNEHSVMVVANDNIKEHELKVGRFFERTKGFTKIKNIQTGEILPLNDFVLKGEESEVFELVK